jgi:hypothetical protein
MPKRLLNQFFGSKCNAPVKLFAKVTIGGTGAPTLVTTSGHSKGIASIARTGTGAYTLTLSDAYSKLLNMSMSMLYSSATTIGGFEMKTDTVSTTKIITFLTKDVGTGGGSAADPASGTVMYLEITLDASKS